MKHGKTPLLRLLLVVIMFGGLAACTNQVQHTSSNPQDVHFTAYRVGGAGK